MMKSKILILGLILCLSGCAVENTIPETTTDTTTIESSSDITTSVDNTETTTIESITQTLPIETTEETTLEDSTNQTTSPTETTFEPYSEGDIRGSLPIVSSEETNESDITLITGTPKIIFNETNFPIEIEANPYGLYYSYTGDYAYIPEVLVPYVKAVPTDYTISGNYMDDLRKPDTDFLTELGEKDIIFYFHDNGTLIGEQTVTIKIIDTIKPTVTIQGAVKDINNDLCSLVTEVSDSIFGNYTYAPTFDDLTLFSWTISEDGFRQYASGESAFYYTDILYWDNTGMHYIMNVCYKLDKENGIGIEDFRIAP